MCRICQKEKFAELLFFGTEDDENARFIELADCHYIIEVNSLIQWMGKDQNNGSIQYKKCPRCTALIRYTKSLNKYIQASVRDIQAIKIKTFGDPHENMDMRNRLETKVKDVLNSQSFGNDPLRVRNIYIEIRNSLSESNKCTQLALFEISNKINLLAKLQSTTYENRKSTQDNISAELLNKFETRLRITAEFVRQFKNSAQQRTDLPMEICFLEMMVNAIVDASWRSFKESGEGQQILSKSFEIAHKCGPASKVVQIQFQQLVTEACQQHSNEHCITFEEKEMILKAMDQRKGSWYKCPNGHIYSIGDCGGPMEKSRCPECGFSIGALIIV